MNIIRYTLTALILSLPLASSAQQEHQHSMPSAGHQHGGANTHMNQRPFEDLVATFEEPGRDEWQKPAEVLAMLGDLRGKTVMDIGSGTGYFSFRLADAGARVICADVDERFLGYIREEKQRRNISDERMELRHVPYDSSTLKTAEADIVLIVDAYHHIQDRVDYFSEVRRGLKPGGKLVVIDFVKREVPPGPPVAMKLAEDEVAAELVRAGFSGLTINRDLLPYQYIVEAY